MSQLLAARLIAVLLSVGLATQACFAVTVAGLQVDNTTSPMGVDSDHPALSWRVEGGPADRGVVQGAYQILVAATEETLQKDQGDLWDSGKVAGDQTLAILYAGKSLASAQRVFWKVRAWDGAGAASAWSTPATFTMGLLHAEDWGGKWIGAEEKASNAGVILRHDFAVKPGLKRATLFICGLGQYECTINGKKVSADLLAPGWTNYRKTCLYDTYDVTSVLVAGKNAAGVELGNGMYNVQKGRYAKFTGSFGRPQAMVHLRLDYADGRISEAVFTDETWKVSPGATTFSNVFGGEDFDARLVEKGWNEPGFDDSKWKAATTLNGPGGALKGLSFAAPPIRAFEVFKPVATKVLRPGVAVYDLGQNAAMMPRVVMSGPAGSTVKITPAELVNADGSVDRGSVGGGDAHWQYTLAGGGQEAWFPKFFYQGARYLQVEMGPASPGGALPKVVSIEGVVVHSSAEPNGTFECSSDLFNKVNKIIRWAQVSNMMSLMTDCPHREKLGWLEESHLNGPALRYDFDMTHFFHKVLNDIGDSQRENGLVPDIAPEFVVFSGGFRDSPEWGSALCMIAWQQYEMSGDPTGLTGYYDNMKKYVDYLTSKSKDHIVSHGLGDWYDIGPKGPGEAQLTPKALTATAFYFVDAQVVAKAARIMHNDADASKYEALAADIKAAFNTTFYDAAKGSYATGSQCANSIPLVMHLAEDQNRDKVLAAVVADVKTKGLTAGDVGYRYLLRALADGGRSDVIFAMNHQSTKPGYGYQLKQGATSLTEAWDGNKSSSQNHFMLGQIMEWFYHDLAGIRPATPGFKTIEICPAVVGDLTYVRASIQSPYGIIKSAWRRDETGTTFDVTIPANTTATLIIPVVNAENAARVKVAGVVFLRAEKGTASFAMGSGSYSLMIPRKGATD